MTEKTEYVTPNRLVSLKVLVFLFFGALQCMYAFLPHHMEYLGFTRYDIRLITFASALVSIIGPLIVGFILDRLSIKRPSAYGKWLRILLFIFFILAGVFFGSLLLISPGQMKEVDSDDSVTFSCRDNGGYIYARKDLTDGQCKNLEGLTGELKLIKCSYTCETPENFKDFSQRSKLQEDPNKSTDTKSSQVDSDENTSADYDYSELTPGPELGPEPAALISPTSSPLIPPPHICLTNTEFGHCHVYLNESVIVLPDVKAAKWDDSQINEFNEDWCKHPLESFNCHVPEQQIKWMEVIHKIRSNYTCTPAVECHISNPFEKESILRYIERTYKYTGQTIPYNVYILLRVIAELFPVIIHMLLNIAIIIATRETSVGRGNIGQQWAFYPIGLIVFATFIGLINHTIDHAEQDYRYFVPILTFSITMFICAVVVLLSGKLPLTPSDWWWHTKCGMLAIPMSALKRYKWVIAAIVTVAFILGGLWHIQEAYRHLFSIDLIEFNIVVPETPLNATALNGTVPVEIPDLVLAGDLWRTKAFVYIIGALIATPIIWNGEMIVDYLGHSNIFILAFVSFALRFAGLYYYPYDHLSSLFELLEPLSFYLPWLALILFTRHLIPKKFLALGQGLLVILFFALGRAIGFIFGTSIIADNKAVYPEPEDYKTAELNDFHAIYTVGATIACIAAIIYFTIYHCILLPYYHVPTNRLGSNTDTNVSPQRVFHDERSRKGYFRY
ncbi:uncharacterized protein SP1173 [Chironomus tepperi]|uniref:uncharacterized protein SP1173 n=1 Tax=Chironomus tepperi TaxID=113505 RepID=UPI00391F789B